jgi:hypothetical protein
MFLASLIQVCRQEYRQKQQQQQQSSSEVRVAGEAAICAPCEDVLGIVDPGLQTLSEKEGQQQQQRQQQQQSSSEVGVAGGAATCGAREDVLGVVDPGLQTDTRAAAAAANVQREPSRAAVRYA